MKRWQILEDPSYLFTELSSEIMLYLVCFAKEEKDAFLKAHHKKPRDVTEVNLGDTIIYVNSKKEER